MLDEWTRARDPIILALSKYNSVVFGPVKDLMMILDSLLVAHALGSN